MHSTLTTARLRGAKIARLLRHRKAWSLAWVGVRSGVFPSFEHAHVPFASDFATVVDAGTSRGQFALFALWRFPDARLICFEPLPGAAAVATDVLPANRVELHAIALGASAGKSTFHVSSHDDSSSLLPIGPRQIRAFPGTEEARQLTVSVDVLEKYLRKDLVRRPCLLKIDVQGAELDVLHGAGAALDAVDEVFVEGSFTELYAGQPLVHEIVSYLAARGFRLVDVSGLARSDTGEACRPTSCSAARGQHQRERPSQPKRSRRYAWLHRADKRGPYRSDDAAEDATTYE